LSCGEVRPFLLYSGFVKVGIGSLDLYIDVRYFDAVTLMMLKERVSLFVSGWSGDWLPLDSHIAYDVADVFNPFSRQGSQFAN
jgi:hypothetical protein